MTFLATSKDLEKDGDFLEDDNLKKSGDFSLIEEKADSKIGKENALLIKGNIYGEEGLKTIEDIDEINEKFLETADGSFTAIDIHQDGLRIYRDRFGSRPVYFLEREDEIFVSDRIKPLLNFTETRPNIEVCLDYLHSGLVDHRSETFFAGIKQLRPEECLFYSGGNLEIEKLDRDKPSIDEDLDSLVKEELRKKIPEKDFVCPVSGGLDSSIIASLTDEAEFVHVNFDVETGDKKYYQELKQDLDLSVTEFEFNRNDLIDFVDEGLAINEYPTGMLAIQAMQMLHRETRAYGGNRVVDGTGADEIFLGYPQFIPYYIDRKFDDGLFQGLKAVKNHFFQLDYYGRKELARLLTPYSNAFEVSEIDHVPGYERPENIEEAVEKNFQVYDFPHILYAKNKSAEFHSIETVYPFLSSKFLCQRDLTDNFGNAFTKKPLRDAFSGDLPDKIVSRKKKTGFIHTDNRIFNEEISNEFRKIFSSEKFQERDFFDGELFYQRFRNDLQSFFKCYRFYCLEKWMRKFID